MERTTLSEFRSKVGIGRVAAVAGDPGMGFELSFKSGQVDFLFMLEGDCKISWEAARAAVRNLSAFLKEYPSCENVTLHSISVKAGRNFQETYFKGFTNEPYRQVAPLRLARLFAPITTSLSHAGGPYEPLGLWVAGMSSDNPTRSIAYASGIVFFYEVPVGGEDLEKTVIKRITIFKPKTR